MHLESARCHGTTLVPKGVERRVGAGRRASLQRRLVRARKTLIPTAEGYIERVEVDAGAGFFEYSALMMSRVLGPKQ